MLLNITCYAMTVATPCDQSINIIHLDHCRTHAGELGCLPLEFGDSLFKTVSVLCIYIYYRNSVYST